MGWTSLKPNYAGSLKEAIEGYRTRECRTLAAGYLSMLEEAGGIIPHKSDLDLKNFVTIMPCLALVAITKPDKCIYRIAGERLKERVGLNMAGRNYYDFVPQERRATAAKAMNMAIDTPCAFRAEILQNYSDGGAILIEATGFPLKSSEPGIDGFILFADQAVEDGTDFYDVHPQLQGANVIRRELINLGFGIDESFVDLVQTK